MSHDAEHRWSEAREILAVRLDTIGDVLMTGPALRALKSVRGDRRLTLLTSSSGALAAQLMPCVDDVIVHEASWMKPAAGGSDPGADTRLIAELTGRGFDAAAIFTVYSQSPLPAALTCHLAGIPVRLAHCREKPYGLLTDWLPELEPEQLVRHEVRRQLDLVAATGARTGDENLSLEVPQAARARVDGILERLEPGAGGDWAVVHPGSTAASRRYPPGMYAEACERLVRHGISVVFTGDRSERELVDEIRSRMTTDSPSLAGELDLAELAALLAAAPVLVAGNTGPVHVAASVGTPVVDLYALTNPQHTPWGVPSRVLFQDVPCRWCYSSVCPEGHHRCLRGVSPEEVADATVTLLSAQAG